MTLSQIAQKVGVNHGNVARHLEVLEAEGIVRYVKFGERIRFYKLNEQSPLAAAVRKLTDAFET